MPRVVHFEIGADDPERAVKFYAAVFGWEIKKWEWSVAGMPDYWMVMTGDHAEPGIDGGLMKRQGPAVTSEGEPRAFVCSVGVDSVDEYVKKITDNGGSVQVPKMEIPDVGWIAYCLDTEGNALGIIEMKPGAMG